MKTIINYVLIIALILVSVAFYTLLERKVLGYSHERFGPNKVGILGAFQPFSDALKLFSKEAMKLSSANISLYTVMPLWGLMVSLMIWSMFPFWGMMMIMNLSWMAFFCISSLAIYFLLVSGWSGNSKYSLLGSYRSSSQAISYEIIMIIAILAVTWIIMSYDSLMMISAYSKISWALTPLLICWLVSCLAETNRSPFDFSEGESELVSGFNTEYSGGLFSLIFIGEYNSILLMSSLTSLMFFSNHSSKIMIIIFTSFAFLWIRSSFPRLRYDKLMMMAWKSMVFYVMAVLAFTSMFSLS